ncbi:28S ribosomal mitochondrial [Brachionus plicatilis]|uniref:Small ribosomal subunit protein mS31 n=1 Tax=Brachionus plicatilis TaxID=10195 RepID=A0A3M7SC64_BRAPC|nr:28S ribosomal mitochondrial [Brachionus plicatilis]
MSFISLNESKPKPNLLRTETKLDKSKKIAEETKKKENKIVTPPFSLQFTAQISKNLEKKPQEKKIKVDETMKNFEKKLNQSAQNVAKLIEKDEKEQKNATKIIVSKLDISRFIKEKSLNLPKGFGEPRMDQMKKNESELIQYMSENSEKFNDDEISAKDEDVASKRPQQNKILFWTDSPYQKFQSLTSGSGLSIFTEVKLTSKTVESPIWSMHHDQELKQAQEILPLNGFEELIHLTNQGKLWKFPIDNEQDVDESDAQVPFHEHVFLDHYLEEFPQIEPIQNFMTLALNGLKALEAERLEASFRENSEFICKILIHLALSKKLILQIRGYFGNPTVAPGLGLDLRFVTFKQLCLIIKSFPHWNDSVGGEVVTWITSKS